MIPDSPNTLAARRTVNPMILFAIEGALLQFVASISGFANNIFATVLGATDAQIGLVQSVPNAAAMVLLLPLGILSDRMRTSRTVPLLIIVSMIAGYLLLSAVPMAAGAQMLLFYTALVFTAGSTVLYNAQWQNFFGDVTAPEHRNTILTLRNRFMFILAIAAPIACGVLLSKQSDTAGKLQVLQLFFLICATMVLLQAITVSRIPAEKRQSHENAVTFADIGAAVKQLSHHKAFLLFFFPVVFFYMTWQFDWSMWYIGQVQYLHLNETELSIINGVFNVGQLVAIGILSRSVRRKGPDYALSFAGLGLLTCPVLMVVSSILPDSIRMIGFLVMMTVLNAPQCATNLCIVQILLRVAPKEYRSMAVSLYTLTVTATNCIMPYLGVRLYTAFGSDYRAFLLFNLVVFIARFASYLLLVWRYKHLHLGEPDIDKRVWIG